MTAIATFKFAIFVLACICLIVLRKGVIKKEPHEELIVSAILDESKISDELKSVSRFLDDQTDLTGQLGSRVEEQILKDPNEFIYRYAFLPPDFFFGSSNIPLVLAIYLTKGAIMELGIGSHSTQIMHKMGTLMERRIVSVDTNEEWLSKFVLYNNTAFHKVHLIPKDEMNSFLESDQENWGVVYVDHGLAEKRYIDVLRFANRSQLVLAHDAESSHDSM